MLLEVQLEEEFVHLSMEHAEPKNDVVVRHRATVKIPRSKLSQLAFCIRCLNSAESDDEESIDLGEGELIVSQVRSQA